MGLVDAIKARNSFVKAIWVFVFLVALSTTVYLVYSVVKEYRDDPTATQVKVQRNATYNYPSIVLCLDTWFSLSKAMKLGFTRRAVHFGLNYLIRYEEIHQFEKKNKNCGHWKQAEQEFLDVYDRLNFTSVLDFYYRIALDTMAGVNFNSTAITFECQGCARNLKWLKPVIVDRGVCYEVPLRPESGKLRGSDGLGRLSIISPNLTDGLVELKSYWRLYINTHVKQIQPSAMFMSIEKAFTTAITISEHSFYTVDTWHDPCVRDANPGMAVTCATRCLNEEANKRFGCRVLSLETDGFHRSPDEYCNRCSWKDKNLTSGSQEHAGDIDVDTCLEACPHECRSSFYDGTVDSHWSSSLDAQLKRANNGSEVKFEGTKIYFKNAAVLRGGVLTYREVATYSFETLMGTIGGTCGIWIGVGVLTIIQLFIFFAQILFAKSVRFGKSVIKNRFNSPSPNAQSPISDIQTSKI